jgi:guanine deaminase
MKHYYNETFMKRAVELSDLAIETYKGGPFGAVIVKDGMIIGEGHNMVTSTNDPTAHAEIIAIRNACINTSTFHLEGCEIYTSCEPCPMCLSGIYWAHIDVIYYANSHKDAEHIDFSDSFIYKEIRLKPDERSIPMISTDNSEAIKVFNKWKDKTDKILY